MPNYTYNTDIPDAPNNPSDDQPLMKVNTNSIGDILNVDMIGFGNTNGGYHSKVTYVDQGVDPGSTSGQYVTYSKNVSGSSEMFSQKDAIVPPIQLTRGVPGTNANGSFSYLPGGFLIQWGVANVVSPSTSVTFPVSFTSIPSVTCSPSYNSQLGVNTVTNTGFIFSRGGFPLTVYWMAIGI